MFFSTRVTSGLLALALAGSAHAHGVLLNVAGANGVNGQGFGVIASTPRDGTTRNPFQQDTSIIRDKEVAKGTAGVCGRTLAGGNNDVTTQLSAAVAAGLPAAAPDGTVSMTLHQVNGDGAGPYTCEVSTDATGASFIAMTVSTNVPGRNSLSNAKATDFPLVAQMPAGVACTGGPNADACLVRCRNSANAGPFGGCVAVTSGSSNATSTDSADLLSSAALETATASADLSSTDILSSTVLDTSAALETATASADLLSSAALDSSVALATATVAADSSVAVESTSAVDSVEPALATAAPAATESLQDKVKNKLKGKVGRRASSDEDDDSIHDAELALAADIEKRRLHRVRRSRIAGRRSFH